MNSYLNLGKEEAEFREVSWDQKSLVHNINLRKVKEVKAGDSIRQPERANSVWLRR